MRKRIRNKLVVYDWLLVLLMCLVVIRIPTLFEPYWYGDEGIYLTIGASMRKGAELYREIHDNKPPLIYLIAAIADGNQFWYRFIALGWNLATVVVFFSLIRKFLENKYAQIMAVVFFILLTNIPLFEGNIANAELFFLLPTLTAANLLWTKNEGVKRVFLAGVLLGLGGLFKMPAVLEAGIWPYYWFTIHEKGWIKKTGILATGVLLPLAVSGIYFMLRGTGSEYLAAAGLQNIPYLSSWKPSGLWEGILSMKGRVIILLVGMGVTWGLSNRLGRRGVLIGIWGLVVLFSALLSGRPYPHYLIQAAGIMAICLGVIIESRNLLRWVGVLVLLLTVFIFKVYGFYHYSTVNYYLNFIKWISNQEGRYQYYAHFDPGIPLIYQVAEIVKSGTNVNDKIFVWGDQAVLYVLSQRAPATKYIVKYHIEDFKANKVILQQLWEQKPKMIVVFADTGDWPGLQELLNIRYHLIRTIGNARIYKFGNLVDLGYN